MLGLPGAALAGDGASCVGKITKITTEACCPGGHMTAEECAKLCDYTGQCKVVHFDVKGMTCGGCESTITGALEKVDGVIKVLNVSHKDGMAVVAMDPTKVEDKFLASTINQKGYKTQVVPAIARTTTVGDKTAAKGCAKTCSPGCAKTCTSKAKTSCGAKTTTQTTAQAVKSKTDGSK
jgi:copper chaperone CopZ